MWICLQNIPADLYSAFPKLKGIDHQKPIMQSSSLSPCI